MNQKTVKIPDQDAAYLHAHHKEQTVPEMAKILKRANTTIASWLEALGLEKKPRKVPSSIDHPFRRANRNLERTLIHFRIENSKRQYKS